MKDGKNRIIKIFLSYIGVIIVIVLIFALVNNSMNFRMMNFSRIGISKNQSSQTKEARDENLESGDEKDLNEVAIEYYMENYGDGIERESIDAKLMNYGCHQEINVFKDGNLVMSLTYFNGQMYEL